VDLAQVSWGSAIAAFAFRLVMPLDGPMGEEPGWRGYAVPALQQRWSPLQSATILGVLASTWHAPLLFAGGSLDYPLELVTSFAATFVYVWLFNRTGGSLLLVLVFHSAEGLVQEAAFGAHGADLDRTSWLTLAVWSTLAVCLIVFDRAAWRRPGIPDSVPTVTSSNPQRVRVSA
jgi:membrane protease YdiL (CAAX protease family)